jgi:hypothetical protein
LAKVYKVYGVTRAAAFGWLGSGEEDEAALRDVKPYVSFSEALKAADDYADALLESSGNAKV